MATEDKNENDKDIYVNPENISFLDAEFDNSFVLQSSINYVKSHIRETENVFKCNNKTKLHSRNLLTSNEKKEAEHNSILLEKKIQLSEVTKNQRSFKKNLKNWGLPKKITSKYENKNITEMFDWQVDCLGNAKVLLEGRNLVYSAPTSAGKTLVAEILTIKTILERQKKVVLILPFVSIVREKMFYLQDILSTSGIRVEGFMGSQSPPGGIKAVHLAICTIEKANSLINKLIDEDAISDLGAIIVDELHLLGDPHRGYILELLLTKVKYLSSKFEHIKIQIIGMSATLPNLDVLSNWLDAELYITEFRPIPLDEYCLVGNKWYDKSCNFLSNLNYIKEGNVEIDPVLYLCLETIKESCSVLIFCMTKNRCENLAQNIASSFYKLGSVKNGYGVVLREQLKSDLIIEVLEQLKNCPVGLDQILKNIISFGVAYHHAGLTFDERDIIEGAFKSGAIKVLVATSTLSSGVNLPARKVIIRSPVFQRQPISILTYKQMVGRAGRMGKDVKGESILICTPAEQKVGFNLINGKLDPVKSCIDNDDKFMRAVLELIASQVLCSKTELDLYSKCTLLFYQQDDLLLSQKSLLDKTLNELANFELIRIQTDGIESSYVATSLGKACLSSSMAPGDGVSLFCELQRARQCLVLETDLHLVYLVTPYSVSNQWNDIDWLHLLTLWESLTAAMKRVGELVGVQESFIIRSMRGANKASNIHNKLNIHKRFYTALALQDLVNEVPLSEVAVKFQCARGFLQGLQQASATFAGMVTAFCHQLGWKNMEMLISQFQDRLHFGIHSELLDLMKLSSLNGVRARTLFDAGFETIASIASANTNLIESALYKSVPFQSEKERDCDDNVDLRKRNKIRNIWITGCCGMTAKEAAENLILEARKYLQQEIGVTDIKWDNVVSVNVETVDKLEESSPVIIKQDLCCENIVAEVGCNLSPQDVKKHIEISGDDIKSATQRSTADKNSSCKIEIKNNLSINNIKLHENNNEVIDGSNIIISDKISTNDTEKTSFIQNRGGSLSIKEADVVWDSLIFSDTALDDISKLRLSIKNNSLNISFADSADEVQLKDNVNEIGRSDASSVKDISLFSSEGDNQSLFEDSLPLDLIPNTIIGDSKINTNNDLKNRTNVNQDDINVDASTILNAFDSNFEIDEDEDIKLVYEDDNKLTENNKEHVLEDNFIANTQTIKEMTVSESYISPHKRHADTTIQRDKKPKKQRKLQSQLENSILQMEFHCCQSVKNIVKLGEQNLYFNICRDSDILKCFNLVKHQEAASITLQTRSASKDCADLIGTNILGKYSKENNTSNISSIRSLNGIAFCLDKDLCLYFDLKSLDNRSMELMNLDVINFFKSKIMKLNIFSTQYVHIQLKKLLGVDLLLDCIDISLVEWLLQCEEKMSNITELTKKYCDIDLLNVNITVNNQNKTYQKLDLIERCVIQSWCVRAIAEKQKFLFDSYDFMRKTLGTETHVAKILANCEYYGITVDKDLASSLLIDVKSSQDVLQKKAFRLCGYHFNFNSSKDVAKVLGLYKGRKISTRKSVLTAHNTPMASIVIYWRKLNSILTKTLYPLTEQACIYSNDNRITPSYTMFTCTGRISMHEPNLQNVPRTFSIPLNYLTLNDDLEPNGDVIEFNCRNIFKAAPGFILVSADYCQLEMRILTHCSGDAVLTNIMRSDVDVFKSIAASWSGVPEEQVDDDLRQKAKQLCYGILYGMGNRTLSQHLDVTEIEAAVFMDTFFNTYPSLKEFKVETVEKCRSVGYVETIMKRRRYLPDIKTNIASKRSAAERQAINTKIQGSAADITKAAMCAIDTKTNDKDCPPRLILQMHDELIYEVPETLKHSFACILKETMEETVVLNVPLPVKVRTGYTWGSLVEEKF